MTPLTVANLLGRSKMRSARMLNGIPHGMETECFVPGKIMHDQKKSTLWCNKGASAFVSSHFVRKWTHYPAMKANMKIKRSFLALAIT